jgi:hypothetical protein
MKHPHHTVKRPTERNYWVWQEKEKRGQNLIGVQPLNPSGQNGLKGVTSKIFAHGFVLFSIPEHHPSADSGHKSVIFTTIETSLGG